MSCCGVFSFMIKFFSRTFTRSSAFEWLKTHFRMFSYQSKKTVGCSRLRGFGWPSSKITVTKEKQRRKRKSEEQERMRREKSNGCTLSFYNGYFIMASCEKNCWMQKILLAVTYKKIRLDIHIHENFNKAHPLSYHFPFITTWKKILLSDALGSNIWTDNITNKVLIASTWIGYVTSLWKKKWSTIRTLQLKIHHP